MEIKGVKGAIATESKGRKRDGLGRRLDRNLNIAQLDSEGASRIPEDQYLSHAMQAHISALCPPPHAGGMSKVAKELVHHFCVSATENYYEEQLLLRTLGCRQRPRGAYGAFGRSCSASSLWKDEQGDARN
jgi:hypothetical protein